MNKIDYYWSLDISTTNIGLALWDSNGKLVELKHLELKLPKDVSIENRDIYKAEIFRKYVQEYKNYVLNNLNGNIASIIVEEPLGGSNNSNTVSLLFGFNGICRYILYQIFNVYPKKLVYIIRDYYFVQNSLEWIIKKVKFLMFYPFLKDGKVKKRKIYME